MNAKKETELLFIIRQYREGASIPEKEALRVLRLLASMQQIDDSFVIASSVDIPEIDPSWNANPEASTEKRGSQSGGSDSGSSHLMDRGKEIDLAVVVPLREEFAILYSYIGPYCRVTKDPVTNHHYYRFDWPHGSDHPYRCVATFAGEMGTTKASLVTQMLLAKWEPSTLTILGIAAGISEDVRVGDVLVATVVDNYLENSKALKSSDPRNSFVFRLAGEPYRPSSQLLNEVRNFEFAHTEPYVTQWRRQCKEVAERELGEHEARLIREKAIRPSPLMLDGHIACGSIVGTANAFTEWLKKTRDRKYIGLEMESGGVLAAIYDSASNCQSLVLRGVSDFGDDRKTSFEELREGALRRYAVHTATQFLWGLLAVGVLPRKTLSLK